MADFLEHEAVASISTAQNGAEARRITAQSDFDLVVIDTPLSDEEGEGLSISISECTTAGIILLVDPQKEEEAANLVEDYGILVLPSDSTPQSFYRTVKILSVARRRLLQLENENNMLHHKIEEIRIVDRAKLILIQVLKMTEPQAQRYIEKQSMDLRQSRLATAETILRTYEQ